MAKGYGGFLVKHPEIAVLKNEGYTIPSNTAVAMALKEPFKVELDTNNPIDDKEVKRISKIIIKMMNKEGT